MSKELEALERLYCSGNLQLDYVLSNKHKQDYEIIEQALLELKAIKEALEPSVILKFVDGLLKRYEGKTDYNIYITKDWLLEIKQSLLKAQKLKKAWEIVKEHFIFEDRGAETYANQTKYLVKLESKDTSAIIHIHLTQQEFELLKEVLENE